MKKILEEKEKQFSILNDRGQQLSTSQSFCEEKKSDIKDLKACFLKDYVFVTK